MKDHCAGRCQESTLAAHDWLIGKFIKPRLGSRKLLELRPADIAKLHADLQDTPYNAKCVLGLLRTMLNTAERWEMIPRSNPTALIKPYPEKKRERYLSQDELDGLMAMLTDGEADGSIDIYFGAAIRLLVLTGCRPIGQGCQPTAVGSQPFSLQTLLHIRKIRINGHAVRLG